MALNLDTVDLVQFFRRFVREVASSPLYQAMCPLLADDANAIRLYDGAKPTQRRPNLLLAAIHASLLRDPSHDLAQWYATVGGNRAPSDPDLRTALASFLVDRRLELADTVSTGATQTNEVGRSALLLPALAFIGAEVAQDQPLGLVEIGTSAALNLRLDSYRVRYQITPISAETELPEFATVGPINSSVHISTDASRSLDPLPIEAIRSLTIGSRCGSDLNPLDVTSDVQARWLRSLIWPDEVERFERLTHALELAKSIPINVQRGDAVELVGAQIDSVPVDHYPVVLTTWVLTYLPEARRAAFVRELETASFRRPFHWICMEHPHYSPGLLWPDDASAAWAHPEVKNQQEWIVAGNPLVIHTFDKGHRDSAWVATVHPHGRWINWHPTKRPVTSST